MIYRNYHFIIIAMLVVSLHGCFQSAKKYKATKVDGFKPELLLYENKKFVFKVNLCQGIGTFKGTYVNTEKKLTLTVKDRDFSGFLGAKSKSFTFNKINDNKMIFLGDVGCHPKRKEVFTLQ